MCAVNCDVLLLIVVAHKMLLMLLMMFHGLTDAVVAATQHVVATTCHSIESAQTVIIN